MGVGYFEAMVTPFEVIAQDLELMGLEDEYGQKHEDPGQNKKDLNYGTPQQ